MTKQEAIAHIKEYPEKWKEFITNRTVEEYFDEYWYKYEDGGIYECVCADLGIEPRKSPDLSAEIKRLKQVLTEIANDAGAPVATYAQDRGAHELRTKLTAIANKAAKALRTQ